MPSNQYIPQGQTPLTLDPLNWGQGQWQGPGGGDTAAQYYTAVEFNKLFGRNPTQSELDQFSTYFKGADPNISNVTGGNQAVSSYFNQQQQLANAPKQEAQQIQQQIPIIQDLINQQMTGTIKNLTDPNSPQYQQFSGNLNNLGITPSSGAFQSGLGGTIGNAANQYLSQALGAVGLPIAQTYAQGSTTPFTNAMNQPQQLFGQNLQLQDFLQQMIAGQNIAEANAPGWGEKYGVPLGSAAIQGAGNAASHTSYVCKELIKRGLICEQDMEDFHVHIMPAMFKKGRAFWKYAMDGERLVNAVNAKGLEWKAFKPLLFDRVMEEKDPCKSVDLYADACHQLCLSVKGNLWDSRVYRTSFWDSLKFIPRLFCYKPFLEALWKCIRFKLMFVLDKPRCEVHRGI